MLATCREAQAEILICSDANTVFIDSILHAHNLKQFFDNVFTNPAHFDTQGRLNIGPLRRPWPVNKCRKCLVIAVLLLESGDAVAEQAVETATGEVAQAVQGKLEKNAPVLSGIRLK